VGNETSHDQQEVRVSVQKEFKKSSKCLDGLDALLKTQSYQDKSRVLQQVRQPLLLLDDAGDGCKGKTSLLLDGPVRLTLSTESDYQGLLFT